MASRKQCPPLQHTAKPALDLMPSPNSSRDVVMFLQYAACLGFADLKLVAHLTEMGALFPQEMLGAYRAYRDRQASDN